MPKIKKEKFSNRYNAMSSHTVPFKKDLGQHILKNPLIVDSMIEKVSHYFDSQLIPI